MRTRAQLLRLKPVNIMRPSYTQILILIDSHIEALDEIQRLKKIVHELEEDASIEEHDSLW